MAIGTGHRSNNYSESKRNDHLDNNRRQKQRNKGIPNKSHPNFREEHKSFSSIFVSNIPLECSRWQDHFRIFVPNGCWLIDVLYICCKERLNRFIALNLAEYGELIIDSVERSGATANSVSVDMSGKYGYRVMLEQNLRGRVGLLSTRFKCPIPELLKHMSLMRDSDDVWSFRYALGRLGLVGISTQWIKWKASKTSKRFKRDIFGVQRMFPRFYSMKDCIG
ncbi:hypothetical protein Tco_0575071 [Tanacetum coccineum]